MRPDKMEHERDNGQNQQNMDGGAGHMHRRETKDPQQQENHKKGYKHTFPPLSFGCILTAAESIS